MLRNTQLWKAAKAGDKREVMRLLDCKGDPNTIHNGITVMHAAVSSRKINVVNHLYKSGAVFSYARPSYLLNSAKRMPIHNAIQFKSKEMVEALLKLDEKQLEIEDTDGNRPIHYAIAYYKPRTLQFLISSGADVTVPFPEDPPVSCLREYARERIPLNPLGAAVLGYESPERFETIRLLLKTKKFGVKDLITTPLELAETGEWRIVMDVIKEIDPPVEDLEDEDLEGETLLHVAARQENLNVILFLKEHGKVTSGKRDDEGRLADALTRRDEIKKIIQKI